MGKCASEPIPKVHTKVKSARGPLPNLHKMLQNTPTKTMEHHSIIH